jgi:hypothetical protein
MLSFIRYVIYFYVREYGGCRSERLSVYGGRLFFDAGADGLGGFITGWPCIFLIGVGGLGLFSQLLREIISSEKISQVFLWISLGIGLLVLYGCGALVVQWSTTYVIDAKDQQALWLASATTVTATLPEHNVTFTYADRSKDKLDDGYGQIITKLIPEGIRLLSTSNPMIGTEVYGQISVLPYPSDDDVKTAIEVYINEKVGQSREVVKVSSESPFTNLPDTSVAYRLTYTDFDDLITCYKALVPTVGTSVMPPADIFFITDTALGNILMVTANGFRAPFKAVESSLFSGEREQHNNRWYASISLTQ